MSPGRGRRRGQRWITEIPEKRRFEPEGTKRGEDVKISLEELEAIRLVDLLELQQQEAALYMGISRKAFWNDLRSGRKKVAAALVYGLGMTIEGGSYILREGAPKFGSSISETKPEAGKPIGDQIFLMEREMLAVEERLASISSRMEALKKRSAEYECED
ncbi:MAG: DUF134 domain-containing protein [Methanothrix sp.]|jgi:predicted DNA-binding protein (UPF0251 family)|uniref:UPF0251 protein XD72_1636 n=1 Tax=Methanothrix harundinacea TaxID=301375 RepID=A0A117MCG7_9EURY|nr:MAG: Uncharacterized protein XD72_1636 [Methanothrix harundinacea]MDD2639356.1 DUF134 domain-containing protein [Methanothrix sp.]MDI9399090.1 DUF134 domain-containing protein [Euryarchaeota archaeon]KUK96444.1 MAG: Uncharacterized protein XE07_1115 [Methanothrix harundinacea]MCP1393317.1 DUF134 domain-containing protein [Methanothrix harundinacea]